MPAYVDFDLVQIADITHRYQVLHESCRAIAEVYSVAKNTIRRLLLEQGVHLDKRPSLSRLAKGRPGINKGKKFSEAHCRAIGDSKRGHKYCVGRVLSPESRQKMRDSRKRHFDLVGRKPVIKNRPPATDEARCRMLVRMSLKRLLRGVLRWTKQPKVGRAAEVLGYSHAELRAHIEAQFQPGMSWLDRSSFHIDHIIPMHAFFERGVFNPAVISALVNLRPLPPDENRRKQCIYDGANWDADYARILSTLQ